MATAANLLARAASQSDSTFSTSLSARRTSDSSPRPAASRDVAAATSVNERVTNLVVDADGPVGQEEVEVRLRHLGLDVPHPGRHRRAGSVRHRLRLVPPGGSLAAERDGLGDVDHERDVREVDRHVPELDHQHRIVEGGRRRHGGRGGPGLLARGADLGALLAHLGQQVGETDDRRRRGRQRVPGVRRA